MYKNTKFFSFYSFFMCITYIYYRYPSFNEFTQIQENNLEWAQLSSAEIQHKFKWRSAVFPRNMFQDKI